MAGVPSEIPKIEITRYESLPKLLKLIVLGLTIFGIGIFIFYIFSWSIGGKVLESFMFYYLLYVAFFTGAFISLPMRKKDRNRVPWYDLIFAALIFGIFIYLATNAHEIMVGHAMWLNNPSMLRVALACIISLLALEAGRVVSIDDLIARVWGAEFLGEPQVIYVHIRWLREKIENDPQRPKRIVNVRGVGYKLVASPS